MKAKSLFFISSLATITLGAVGLMAIHSASAMTPRPSTDKSLTRKDSCFYGDRVRSYETKGDHHMIVTTTDNQAYDLELAGGCFNVDSAMGIAIVERHGMGRICGAFDADVHYMDFDRPQRCSITSVKHLEGDEAAPYVRAPKTAKTEVKNEN